MRGPVRGSVRGAVREAVRGGTPLLDTALVNLTTEGIQTTGGAVTSWENSGAGGSDYDLNVVLGTGANLRVLQDKSITYYGASGDFVSTPDSVANSVTGSAIFFGYITPTDNTPAVLPRGIITKWLSSGDNRSYLFTVDNSPSGNLTLFLSQLGAGAGGQEEITSTIPTGIPDGTGYWAFAVYDSATPDVTFYTSLASSNASVPDAFTSATQLGIPVPNTFTAIFDGISDVEIGSFNTGSSFTFTGGIRKAGVISGTDINGTNVVPFDASQAGNKTGVASDTFISGGVTFTMHGDTFANNTGHSIVNSSGGAGLESTAGQLIEGKITRFVVVKMNELTATQQSISSAKSDAANNPAISVSSGDDFIFEAGSTLTAGAADLDIHIITVQYNQDATTILSVSGIGSVTGNAGSEDYDYGTLFADISGGTTANMAILQDITFSSELNPSEVSRVQSELNRRYKGIST